MEHDVTKAYEELHGLLFSVPPKPIPEELLFRIHDLIDPEYMKYIVQGAYDDGWDDGKLYVTKRAEENPE